MYSIVLPGDAADQQADAAAPQAAGSTGSTGPVRAPILRPMGSVKRKAAGSDRVVAVRFDGAGTVLGCQGAGKTLELYRCVKEFFLSVLRGPTYDGGLVVLLAGSGNGRRAAHMRHDDCLVRCC